MSGIVLSASVRQNLLSLQSTASLLATTQNDLATGNKVNSALDNPTEFFTAQGLNNRAGDINNLLDGIGNGVQVLQAANTGITSLQSLVSSAQSIANQVLQAPTGYTTKSSVTADAQTGATANNLLGTGPAATDATFASATAGTATTAAVTAAQGTETGATALLTATTGVAVTTGTVLGTASGDLDLSSLVGETFTVGGQTINFTAATSSTTSGTTSTIGLGTGTDSASTVQDILNALDAGSTGAHGTATLTSGGAISLSTTTTDGDFTFAGTNASDILTKLGLDPTVTSVTHTAAAAAGTANITTATQLSGTATGSNTVLSTAFAGGDTLTVNNQTITFATTGTTSTNATGGTINITTGTVNDILQAIDKITGSSGTNAASITAGKITLHTGTTQDLSVTSSNATALAALGLGTGVTQARTPGTGGLSGENLTIDATNSSLTATTITFGTGANQVSTLNQLNTALASNDLQASIDSSGAITITTTNNAASQTVGKLTGSAIATGSAFAKVAAGGAAPVADPNSQATRSSLVAQYNNVLDQINTTAQDSSFNGINLLNNDTLNLTFDETGASKLSITGVTFNDAGLGLTQLKQGTDFLDSNSANTALTALTAASTTLRTEATSLGSNLSIVQIRQDFNKNLINVLQTGSSNLTLADTNEEAANSQALSTRQSIAVSALALANQSQQSVLQLLR
jgi:flagellin